MIGKPWSNLERFRGNPNERHGEVLSLAAPNDSSGWVFVAADGAGFVVSVWVRLRADGRWYRRGDSEGIEDGELKEMCEVPAGSDVTVELITPAAIAPTARLELGFMGGVSWKRP